ncbi:MAG: hypothetical protein HZA53_15685 [Planctomycetes bacterium]|nr:hypothetical protein [Planctomycetota bacterium]
MHAIAPLLHSWCLAATTSLSATPVTPELPGLSPPSEESSVEPVELEPARELDAWAHAALVPERFDRSSAPIEQEIPDHPSLTDRFFIGLGTTFLSSNTQARLSSSVGAGAVIDFEEAFGLSETKWAPEGMARWRFSERWRVELEFFSLSRSNSKTIANDITWGDSSIPAGTNVTANFDVSVARLSCGYSFFKTRDKELGVALGFHLTHFKAGVDSTLGAEEEAKLLAPLPVISLYGQCALTNTWALQGRLDALKIAYDPFYGHILSIGVDALCQPWRHVGFGIGWRTLQVEGGVSADHWNGEISTNYTGPILFLSTSF